MKVEPKYKWVVGLSQGKLVFLGPYKDDPDDQAEQIGMDKTDEFEVVKLKYYGMANATRALKHMRLENQTIQQALERVGHKVE